MITFTRGSTPTISAQIPEETEIDFADIASVWFFIKQGSIAQLDKTTEDCIINSEERTISMELTQSDTLQFREGRAKIQISLLLKSGKRTISLAENVDIKPVYKEGVQP